MSIKAGVLLNADGIPFHWHAPEGRSAGGLPHSRNLWNKIWEHRGNLSGFAHSHPGEGTPQPSYTDLTTFYAIEVALGVRLYWWIVSSDDVSLVLWTGPGSSTTSFDRFVQPRNHFGWKISALFLASLTDAS